MHWFPAAELMQNGCPVYLFETNEGIHYGFPSLDGSKAKVAEHSGGILIEADVESAPRDRDEEDFSRVARFVEKYLTSVTATRSR